MFDRYSILLGLSVTLSLAYSIEAKAQLVPDNTLGKENSIVTPTNLLQRIDGGAIRGSNLFHSFKEFNIDSGKSVYFSNPSAIQNILTRVTGKNQSNIFGKLGVLGNANLFLLNPNGIVFGKDASLDIYGSFSATTSPSILFDNGFEFSATNPQAPPLLKVNITPGLQYPRSQQGDIKNQANLTVGKDLNLIGKNLDLTGELDSGGDLNLKASDTLQIRDNSDNPFIASADGDLLLQANQRIDIFALNHSDSGLFSGNDLVLQSSNPVLGDAHYFSGGSFRIEQLDGSLGNLESPNDPIIRASGDVSFDSYDGASLHILAGGSVNITGNVTIDGADGENGLQETVTLSNGESLQIDGKKQATLDIRAGTTAFGVEGVTGSGSFTPGNPNTEGSASSSDIVIDGNIEVKTADGLVFLSNQYSADSSLSGGNIEIKGNIDTNSFSGNGGNIFIDSKGDIETQSLNSYSFSYERNSENGGAIALKAGGDITTNGWLGSYSFSIEGSSKKGGAIALTAGGNITTRRLLDSSSWSFSDGGSSGNGGDITLTAGGNITTSSLDSSSWGGSSEDGGAIALTAKGNITTNGWLYSSSLSENKKANVYDPVSETNKDNRPDASSDSIKGGGGNVTIKAGVDNQSSLSTIRLIDTTINAAAFGDNGKTGNITIEATNGGNIELLRENIEWLGEDYQPEINTKTFANDGQASGEKRGGDIKITGGNVKIDNYVLDATVDAESSADGGSIIINSASKLIISDGTKISTNTEGSGKAGDIDIKATDLVKLFKNSKLSTESSGDGDAGNIKINTRELRLKDNTEISSSSSSKSGQAGNLNITADNLFLNQGELTAKTNAVGDSEGANITLNIKDLLRMENNSKISAKASGSANGGNITIENSKGFIIGLPFEDSDINANASEGKGGNIKINTQNIFGLVFRDQNTEKSDITVSSKSGLRGEVTVNQLNVNPASGLVELPSTLVETTGIQAGCAASAGNTFIVSPKGGLPQSPDDLFHGNATHTDLFDLIPTRDIASDINNQNYPNYRNSTSRVDNKHKHQNQNQIVEATGWVVDANGDVLFVAKMPQDSQKSSDINSVSCKDFSS
jgi:filamentous hemagglutinin family protein